MLRRTVVKNLKYSKLDLKALTKQQVHQFHMTGRADNTLILGGLGLAASGIIMHYGYNFYKSLPKAGDPPVEPKEGEAAASTQSKSEGETEEQKASGSTQSTSSTGGGFFSSLFNKGYYEGGFEDKMTKREAALILGVRESATLERIKDAHRKILLLNHPDRGGSALIAAKINEAKDMLIKGKV